MKHTDFFEKTREIKTLEKLELMEAIMAHGGEFNWGDDEEKPIIAINPDCICPSPIDVEVERVIIDNGQIRLFGTEVEHGSEQEFIPEDAFPGHLSSIIDYIPDTEKVSDVTKPQEGFIITSVSREDLSNIGFDTSKVDDGVMDDLAGKLADDYCEQLFWLSLEIIAEDYFKIPRIWDSWFEGLDLYTSKEVVDDCQLDFSFEGDPQDFMDAFENWWGEQPNSCRKEIYTRYNQVKL